LKLGSQSARGLEVRGVLRYWAEQLGIEGATMAAAERDLAAAVELDPGLPRAWSILSAISEQRGDFAEAYHQARQAYVSDYALTAPAEILVRLFTNALEVGDEEGAAEWCLEIERQHPDEWLGPYCSLTRLAWVGPWNAAEGERLLEEGLGKLGAHGGNMDVDTRLRLLHAVVLARGGASDAAREVLRATSAQGTGSADVLALRAWVHSALGDRSASGALLSAAAELAPGSAPLLLRSRRYSGATSYAVTRQDE
jgi:tetratricopeptide (TPR) repeat protein